MYQIALGDILTNPAISNILPDLVQYLLEIVSGHTGAWSNILSLHHPPSLPPSLLSSRQLSCWVQYSPAQLLRVLRLLSALFKNQHLFLDHFVRGTLT